MQRIKVLLLSIVFVAVSATPLLAGPSSFAYNSGVVQAAAADEFYRTELYFGRSMPGGGIVSDEEWEKFLEEVVTPRFPDGFTILKATGKYREKSGKIITEPSEVLVFLYSRNKRISSRCKIEEIRRAYVKQFNQESVLRMDLPRTVKVLF